MKQIHDHLVSYFGLDEEQQPDLSRYYCYQIVGGPGPSADAGFAVITALAVYNEAERCTFCQAFHAVETGGPAAAIEKAIGYLDSVHRGKHLRKVQAARDQYAYATTEQLSGQ